MSISAKHLATFILGAAAGVALNKYLQTEEGEKMMEDLKEKGNAFRAQAEDVITNAPDYFEKLKTEGAQILKEKYPDAENILKDLFASLGKKPSVDGGTNQA
jgi:gas vesicle protein